MKERNEMDIKFYSLERKEEPGKDYEYRFRSLFNNCIGSWKKSPGEAEFDGEQHTKVVKYVYKTEPTIMLKQLGEPGVDS